MASTIITSGATIIVSLITLVGVLVSNKNARDKTLYRIECLEKKQDKHNSLMERMIVVEQRSKSNQHRIDELFLKEEKR